MLNRTVTGISLVDIQLLLRNYCDENFFQEELNGFLNLTPINNFCKLVMETITLTISLGFKYDHRDVVDFVKFTNVTDYILIEGSGPFDLVSSLEDNTYKHNRAYRALLDYREHAYKVYPTSQEVFTLNFGDILNVSNIVLNLLTSPLTETDPVGYVIGYKGDKLLCYSLQSHPTLII